MILYADTSALMKLLLQESGTAEMEEATAAADRVLCTSIGYAELRAAMGAAFRAGRVGAVAYRERLHELEELWGRVSEIEVDRRLVRQAGNLADEMALRGYDAVHLAGLSRAGPIAETAFACWDADLRRAAQQLGYSVIPA